MIEERRYLPISEAPKDGRTLLVADDILGGWRAVAHWAGDFWALGHKDDDGVRVEVDFVPTRFVDP